MRRNTRDELLSGFLAINAMLREELGGLRRTLERRSAVEAKYNPNWAKQPRAPRGVPEGGQWVDGGGRGGSKQLQRPRPSSTPEPQRPQPQRLPITANDNAAEPANDAQRVRLAISAFQLFPPLLALPLSSSTQQPKIERRQITGDLFLVVTETPSHRDASFQRVVRPERNSPQVILGVETGLLNVEPADTETLRTEVRLEGDEFVFEGNALAAEYGRHITGVTWSPSASSSPQIVPLSPEERRLEHNLREMFATPDQIAIALQNFRNSEADGEPFMAALRERGASPDFARRIRNRLRFARSVQPYTPPSSGPLVDMFPGLSTAGPRQALNAVDNLELPISAFEHSQQARALVREIASIDSTYQSDSLRVSGVPAGQRREHLDRLRLERAALLWRRRQEIEPLQVEMIRLTQRRVDLAYADVFARYESGELRDSTFDLGDELDRIVRQDLRNTLIVLGIREDDVIGVNRALRPRRGRELRPDAHIADIFLEITVDEKDAETDQIIDYFEDAYMKPKYVIIIHPRRIRPSFLITPPQRRYARDWR